MRKFQLVIDLEVTDAALTENTLVTRWKKDQQLLPGVLITNVVAIPTFKAEPGEGLNRSLADVPNFPRRLLSCCRNAEIHTVAELAETLPRLHMFRGVGHGMIKQAISVCIAHGATIKPDELEPSHRTYALQQLAQLR